MPLGNCTKGVADPMRSDRNEPTESVRTFRNSVFTVPEWRLR